ncbi:MAG: hypothetical protein WDM81_21335 [Rhizomicrobium sp.]
MKRVGALGPDDQVLVLGVGGVGMMGVQFAKAMFGLSRGKDWGPIAADIDDGKLEAAKKAGASATYNTKEPDAAKKLVADTKAAPMRWSISWARRSLSPSPARRCGAAAR